MSNVVFAYKETNMNSFIEDIKLQQVELESTYQLMNTFFQELKEGKEWQGFGRNEFVAYTDLLVQYMGALFDESPMDQMVSELEKFRDNMSKFYEEASSYRTIKNL